MDENKKPLIVALAEQIAGWFPDLGGRSIAVSESDPFDDKTNIPTLPLAFVALVNERGTQGKYGGGRVVLTSDLAVQFIYHPHKYERQDGNLTPFFAFYDYESLRDRLLTFLHSWRTPGNGAISYSSMDVESNEFAVHITFRFIATRDWCPEPELMAQPFEFTITSQVHRPRSTAPCDPCEECKPVDPCDFAR